MDIKKLSGILISALGFLLAGSALGSGYTPLDLQPFQLQPRANFWGFTGDNTRGEGQMLMPIYGNQTRAFYGVLDGNVAVNDTDWLAGAGLGYRHVVQSFILGAYAFADYQHSKQNNEYWIANPGLEMLGTKWDVNVNGYLPFGQKKNIQITEKFAQDSGTDNFERLEGHNVFDHKFEILGGEEASRGLDFEIGRVIPSFEQARIYVGGYHFDSDDAGSTNGLEARLVWEFNKYVAFEAEENNDNKNHNTFVAGLRFTLGGYSAHEKAVFGISSRLMDPIEHDFVISIIPTPAKKATDLGEVLVHDNVWFFESLVASGNDIGPGFPQGSGTFEDPFFGFTPANVSIIPERLGPIDQHPLLYFAPGAYSFTGFSVMHGAVQIPDRFNLSNGWSMFGRTKDYMAPAMGNDRAQFSGGLDMNYVAGAGGEEMTLNSIRIVNIKVSGPGETEFDNATLYLNNAANVVLQNSDIEKRLNDSTEVALGVYGNASVINFRQLNGAAIGENTILGSSDNNFDSATVVGISGDSGRLTINFESGNNNVISNGSSPISVFSNCMLGDFSEINFKGGVNTVTAFSRSGDGSFATAMYDGNINFFGGDNKLMSIASGGDVWSMVIFDDVIMDFRGGNNEITSIVETATDSANSYGIRLSDNADIRVNGASISSGTLSPSYALLTPYVTISRITSGSVSPFVAAKIAWYDHDSLAW